MSIHHITQPVFDVASSIAVKTSDAIGWSNARKIYVENYVKQLQNILRLQDWKISIDWKKFVDEDDAFATNTPLGHQRRSVIHLSHMFLGLNGEDQAQTLVHELLHCHIFALDNLAGDTVDALASKSAGKVFEVALEAAVECTTDTLADILLPFVPEFKLPEY